MKKTANTKIESEKLESSIRDKLERLMSVKENKIEGIICNYILKEDRVLQILKDIDYFGCDFFEEFENIDSSHEFFDRHYSQLSRVLIRHGKNQTYSIATDVKEDLAITGTNLIFEEMVKFLNLDF